MLIQAVLFVRVSNTVFALCQVCHRYGCFLPGVTTFHTVFTRYSLLVVVVVINIIIIIAFVAYKYSPLVGKLPLILHSFNTSHNHFCPRRICLIHFYYLFRVLSFRLCAHSRWYACVTLSIFSTDNQYRTIIFPLGGSDR